MNNIFTFVAQWLIEQPEKIPPAQGILPDFVTNDGESFIFNGDCWEKATFPLNPLIGDIHNHGPKIAMA